MNEWKELQIDNLPPDILTGDYEWEWTNKGWCLCEVPVIDILTRLLMSGPEEKYCYRKPEPQQPSPEVREKYLEAVIGTYEDLMRKSHDLNSKLLSDLKKLKTLAGYHDEESADIPPEEK